MVTEIAGGERWFSAIYAADLVEGIIAASREPRAPGRTYFLAHSGVVSWSELVATAARIMGRIDGSAPRRLRISPAAAYAIGYCGELWSRLRRKPGIVSRDKIAEMQCRYWVCDTRRAKAEIGFEAATDIQAGLAHTLAWYRAAGWLKWA
jgi:nucleoside-diphosphate-sugar epimerase